MGSSLIMKPKKIQFSTEELKSKFYYKNGFLIKKNEKIAGCLHKSGYRQVRIGKLIYPAHRLIWVYHYGSIDETLQIDHINGIKDDNRIENLRLVSAQENCYNRSRLNAKGYTKHKETGKWQSSISIDGEFKYLGLFALEQEARNAYITACAKHRKEVVL